MTRIKRYFNAAAISYTIMVVFFSHDKAYWHQTTARLLDHFPSLHPYPGIDTKRKLPQTLVDADVPLKTWMHSYRQAYLDATFMNDGWGRFWDKCVICKGNNPTIRYKHLVEPLHRIEQWNGTYFECRTLRSLGLTFQLGHNGGDCPFTDYGRKDFMVIAANGIHELEVNFCGCPDAPKQYIQLLEVGWWPATPLEPCTAAPFSLMRLFHMVNLQACCPATDFYRSLERLTDGTGLEKVPDRLAQFMVMIREWRHIKMLRRAGRGHDDAGIIQ
ncbi:hypothetical protein C8J56DRAFT_1057724 [Mycena floridula]|nr:hypothetical protein C8J56DRAFT_1057724 [Mycena floridula]